MNANQLKSGVDLSMIVALFGITCVGKTTIGKMIAQELGYVFFDLDAEMKLFYNDTITNIQRGCIGDALDEKKARVLKSILDRCGDRTIISMSPIYYTNKYKQIFKNSKVLSIVLQDSPENIADRMIDTDEDDNVLENSKRDRKTDIRDIKYFITRYKKAFERIKYKYDIAGKEASVAAHEIIETIIKPYGMTNGQEA
jgi:shikimate kinase